MSDRYHSLTRKRSAHRLNQPDDTDQTWTAQSPNRQSAHVKARPKARPETRAANLRCIRNRHKSVLADKWSFPLDGCDVRIQP